MVKEGHYGPWDPRVQRNPSIPPPPETPGIHELQDEGGVTLRYQVPDSRQPTPTPIERWRPEHPIYKGEYMGEYYTWDPSLSVQELLDRWVEWHAKAYDGEMRLPTGEYFNAIYSWRDLWPHRRDDRPVSQPLIAGLREHGWLAPVVLRVGRNGCVEMAEGNHRVAAAKELRLEYVPVNLWFVQTAPCPSAGERAQRARAYELVGETESREASIPRHISFYKERPLKFNRGRPGRLEEVFDETFDVVEEQFPNVGTIELHEDEAAGTDNGAGSERQFAYCQDGDPIIIAFAPKSDGLPDSHLRGLMRHEFGHALEYRFGVRALEEVLGKLPKKVERRADAIAEAVFGEPIEYDERCVQCVGVGGKRPRPKHLPDEKAKLKANGDVEENPPSERDRRDFKKIVRSLRGFRHEGMVDVSEVSLDTDLHSNRIRAMIDKYPKSFRKAVGTRVTYVKGEYYHGDAVGARAEPFKHSREGTGHYAPAQVWFGRVR
jgi:hypothetical protein